MEHSEYETMYQVEDQHWWYKGMKEISLTLVGEYYADRSDLVILDAGCGTGAVMNYLAPFGLVTGCDISPIAIKFCRQRGLKRLGQSTVTRLPFPVQTFDLITSFDVLYHRAIGNYREALIEFYRVLKPGGRLFLRLPAYNWLRGHHDKIIHTAHRFRASEIRDALATCQFTVEKLSYANMLLFPLALGKRLAENLFPPREGIVSDVKANSEWQDKFLTQFLRAEARWLKQANLPFGLTVLAIARR